MCGTSDFVAGIFNPGAKEAGARSAAYGAEGAALDRELAANAAQLFGYGSEEYRANKPLLEALRTRASYLGSEAGQESEAGRSAADVERAYTAAKDAEQRDIAMHGGNPNDPASKALAGAGLVRLAAAKVGAANLARRASREESAGLTGQVTGYATPLLTAGLQGTQAAGAGFNNAAQTAQTDPRQGLLGVPGLSIAKGGSVGAGMPVRVRRIAAAPAGTGMPVRDPNPPADIPMLRRPDGSYGAPDEREPGEAGQVSGPGTATSDSIPANLSRDEYIQPAFVSRTLGTPALDSIAEVSRKTQLGDPEARADVMKLLRTIATFKSVGVGVPKRVAGQPPQAPGAGAGMGPTAAPPVAAAGGGLLDLLSNLQPRGQVSTEGSANPQPMPWWGSLGEERPVPLAGQPGKTSLRNLAALAAKIVAASASGGYVGAGLPAGR